MKIMIYDKCKTKCNKTGQIKIHIESMEYTNVPVYDKLHAPETLYDSRIHFLNFSCE